MPEELKKNRTIQDVLRDAGLFIYNPTTNKIMGRTPIRWCKLGLCYLLTYIFLAGITTGMFCVFYYAMLPEDAPKVIGVESVLDGFPGVSRQPSLFDVPIYSSSNKSLLNKVKPFINNLQNYLIRHYRPQIGSEVIDCNGTTVLKKGQLCKMNMKDFFPTKSPCSGLNSYGYLIGKPCVLVKLNKMYDWKPVLYQQSELPEDFPANRFFEKRITMSCFGAYPPDQENIGTIIYIPNEGIDIRYYPYQGQKQYLPPFIWAQFVNVTRSMILKIKCKFFAKDIGFHRRIDISYVAFELLVD